MKNEIYCVSRKSRKSACLCQIPSVPQEGERGETEAEQPKRAGLRCGDNLAIGNVGADYSVW